MEETKKCSLCKIKKPLTSFYFLKKSKKYYSYCRDCRYCRKSNHENNNGLKNRHNMDYEDYVRQTEARGGFSKSEANEIIKYNKIAKKY